MIVSTLISPRVKSCRRDNADGYIILADDKGNRIVAVGLGFTNECVDYPNGKWLYVNATFQKRLSRFDVSEQGALSNKSKVAELGVGTFLDGLTFDVEGGVWITRIVSNRVILITSDGKQILIVEDNGPERVSVADAAYGRYYGSGHLDEVSGKRFKNISSLAFGGLD